MQEDYNFFIQCPSHSGDNPTLENYVVTECSGSHSITDNDTIEFHFPSSADAQKYIEYITGSE